MTMSHDFIDIPERDVRLFIRHRYNTDSQKSPLVLLHGWPASSRGWETVVALLPIDRTIICPDLRGLGQSQRIGSVKNFTKQALAKDILALLQKLGVNDFIIGGQDWGGSVAQEMALMQPERAKALIIMNINLINNLNGNLNGLKTQMMSPLNPRWYMAFQSAPDLAENMIPGSEDIWIRYFFTHGAGKNAIYDESILSGYVDDYSHEGTARCGANYYRSMSYDAQRWASLDGQKFSQPSLLIHGTEDPFLTKEFYTHYEMCFENVTKVDLAGGHFIQDENPHEVAKTLSDFLNSTEL